VQFFQDQGCDMEEMTCERHDELASRTQFVTHTIGRVLGAMDLSVR
jgi:arogenate dehydrogenase (NADP+), plant